jgi:hypothetical protein
VQTLAQQRRLWQRATAGLVLLAAIVVLAPLASNAGVATPFSDVGVNHPFRAEIAEVADAGVAQGYDDGSYRPGDPVTRQAMAAFLSRAGSSIATSVGPPQAGASPLDNNLTEPFRAIAVDVPGDADTTQQVHVQGTLSVVDDTPTGCDPCTLKLQLRDGSGFNTVLRFFTVTPGDTGTDGPVRDTIQIDEVFEVPGGFQVFTLSAGWHFSSGANVSLDVPFVGLTATVIPFDATAALPLP